MNFLILGNGPEELAWAGWLLRQTHIDSKPSMAAIPRERWLGFR